MHPQTISELSASLIMRYYENEPMPFLAHMDDEALWYGPALGQFIKGREAMILAWSREEHLLTFSVGDIKAVANAPHSSACNVMLSYSVVTHYPSGRDLSVNQRVLLCWGERQIADAQGKKTRQPRILVCHISNPHEKHDDDVIYPKNFDRVYANRALTPHKENHLHFHGLDRSDYFYMSDSIMWIETARGGKHSVLHTLDGPVEILTTVSGVARQFPQLFLRFHQSYLVNPHYIRNIRRFQVTLTDGTTLPIPEKRFTAFRREAEKLLQR